MYHIFKVFEVFSQAQDLPNYICACSLLKVTPIKTKSTPPPPLPHSKDKNKSKQGKSPSKLHPHLRLPLTKQGKTGQLPWPPPPPPPPPHPFLYLRTKTSGALIFHRCIDHKKWRKHIFFCPSALYWQIYPFFKKFSLKFVPKILGILFELGCSYLAHCTELAIIAWDLIFVR